MRSVKSVKLHVFLSGSCSWSTHGADGWIVRHGCPAGLGRCCLNLPGVPWFTHRISAFREGAVPAPIPSDCRRGRRLERHCGPQRPWKKDRDRSLKQVNIISKPKIGSRIINPNASQAFPLSILPWGWTMPVLFASCVPSLKGEKHMVRCFRLPAEHSGCEKYLQHQAGVVAVWTGKHGFQTVHKCSCTLTFWICRSESLEQHFQYNILCVYIYYVILYYIISYYIILYYIF